MTWFFLFPFFFINLEVWNEHLRRFGYKTAGEIFKVNVFLVCVCTIIVTILARLSTQFRCAIDIKSYEI